MHITLRFLGNISKDDVARLVTYVHDDLNPKFFPNGKFYKGDIVGVGDFRKSVFFTKITNINTLLAKIHDTINEKLAEFPNIQVERGTFKPHLTIARAKRNRKRNKPNNYENPGQFTYNELRKKFERFEFGSFQINEVVLKQSELTPQGPIYTNLT